MYKVQITYKIDYLFELLYTLIIYLAHVFLTYAIESKINGRGLLKFYKRLQLVHKRENFKVL